MDGGGSDILFPGELRAMFDTGHLDDACEAYDALVDWPAHPRLNPVAGIGVVLTAEGARVACLDLDRVVSPDRAIDTRAETIVERCDSWTAEFERHGAAHLRTRHGGPRTQGRSDRGLRGRSVYRHHRYQCRTPRIGSASSNPTSITSCGLIGSILLSLHSS